jgi:trimethylamine--corrinoid protein Co-methyltransferase
VGARISYLTDDDKAAINEAALEIMSTIGQRVHHPEALELLRAAGATVEEPDLVKIPRELVEKARQTAPAVIEVYDRAGGHAMSLGRYNTYFGNGSAVTSVYDVETGEHRPTVLADGVMAARLCDALPEVDFVMAYAHPGDYDPHVALLQSFRAMVKNTIKPLCVVAENRQDLAAMTDIAAAVRGGHDELAAKPYFVLYLEPTSALSHPVDSLEKLLFCADHGIPAIYSPAPLAGGTAPITIAGQVCQGTAESLLGLVIHQVRKPGAPFLFGIGPAVLDMATSQSSYNAPEYLMGYICAVEMARWLDLPNWGYAGTTDAQVIDAQAGMEAAELTLLSLATGSNLNHDLGYLDYGMTGSLELIVITDEYLSLNRKLFAGVEVTPETLAVDVVRDVGPGGDFLAHRHTAKNVRKAQWRPTIINRQGHVRWEEEGGLDIAEKARRKALKLLAEHEPVPLPADVAARIDALVEGFAPSASE